MDIAEAYETKDPAGGQSENAKSFLMRRYGAAGRCDLYQFFHGDGFSGSAGQEIEPTLRAIWLASIGPVTSKTLSDAGFPPAIEAREYTMPGLVFAITEHVHKMASQELLKRLLGDC